MSGTAARKSPQDYFLRVDFFILMFFKEGDNSLREEN